MKRYRCGLWAILAITACCGAIALGAAPFTEPDAILQINSDSLTTYLPSSASGLQNIFPLVGQRGTGIDGELRSGTPLGMAIGGNPFRGGCGDKQAGSRMQGGVCLSTGAYVIEDVDLVLPCAGVPLVVGRSYGAVQYNGSSHHTSAGFMGNNWFQTCQPELVFYDGDQDLEATDVIYLVYGADRFAEYKRVAADSEFFRGVNGAAGVIEHTADGGADPGTYCLTDQRGTQWYFLDDDGDAGEAAGQFWKAVDTADNTLFVGDADSTGDALTYGFVSGKGCFEHVYDDQDRHYEFTYTDDLLTEVKAETKTGGTWGG
ncbi:hypothetical protein KJ567_00135, partial [Candidatus Bipolaricaulota bacterium]|nr:hypothetical protein [Candidatus Bipolaricaulota bacterium]